MGLIKNKKAVIKASITIFSLLAISAVIAFATGVFAFTHDSTANITPDLVQASTQYNFAVEVSNLLSSEDPVSEFRIYMESSGSNPNPFTNIVCNSKSGWNGPFIISSSEGDYCLYTAQSVSDRIFPGESEDFSFDAESPRTGSCRTFKFETRDPDQFWRPIEDEVCVDNQAPVTTKQFEGPQKIENGVEWIDGISTIVLTAEDPQPHPAGVDETFYKLSGPVDDSYCYNSCDEWQTSSPDGEGWYEYSEPLGDIEESCHVLEFYSTDNLGNVEDVNANCFFVDKTPPIVRKDVGRPQVPCESESECDYYISSETDITLTCEDVGPHPSDDVTIYWRYRVDNEGNGFGDDSWTDEFSENSEEAVFSFPEPSMHELEYWCVDAVEKESQHLFEIDKVDNEAPVITKEMIGEHHLGQCPPRPNTDDECYVADNRENGVSISVEDPNQNHAVNGVSCNYELWWKTDLETCIREFDGTHLYNPDTGQCFVEGSPFEYSKDIIFTEDSTHTLKIWCEDALGNEVYDEEDFLVDSAPPETSKAYGTPAYPADINTGGQYPHYITSQTPITLTAADAKVGVNKTYYRTTLVDDRYCFTEYSGCQNYDGEINEQFVEYTNPFTMEQSCHLIEFYSVDKLGNEEEINRQCVFVDNTAPEGSKEVGSPSIEIEEGNLIDWYVNTQTPIYLSCEDQEPHPVNHETVYWRFSWWPQGFDGPVEYSEWFSDEDGETIVYFEEDSWHDLEFYCEDALGNKGEIDLEYFVVDSQPPEIEKEIVGPYVMCSEDVDGEDGSDGDNGEEQVNSVGDEIDTITFPEGADTGVGVAFDGEFLYYTYIDSKNLYKIRPDGSGHEVITTSGISETGLGALSYDATRDKIWAGTYGCDKDNGGPVYLIDKETGEATYMFSVPSTYITYCLDDGIAFDASDDSIWYSDDIADTMVHMNTDGTFLGTVDLDTIHPDLADNSGIAIGGDNFYLGTDGHETTIRVDRDTLAILDTFVNTNFRIEDMECDPNTYSPIEVMWIRDAYAGQVRAYEIEPATCGLGGEEPEPKQDCFIIDGVTEIHVDASDPEPHPVGDVTCEWGYTWDEEFYGWFEEDELPFVISGWDESKHDLEINCWDGLGNEIRDIETFLVDKTPPGIDKKYGEPYFSWQFDDYWAEWISSQTPIQISVVDEGPHLSGIKEVKYRTSIVEDEYCKYQREEDEFNCEDAEGTGSWIEDDSEFEFNISEESCHLIEIVATDNVDKTSTHKQCVFVDNSAPEPEKTVEEPSEPWDGLDANFYDLAEFCSVEGNCWKVTTMTPITLDCQDVEPHPVDHEEIFFKVELDGDDYTERYCENIAGGEYNINEDGYCYVSGKEAPVIFHFTEESEHNLKYYCIDALGNKGPVDDEKFKVQGDAFTIEINKKWNLISVPVKLLDDSMDVVFESPNSLVQSVWQFDGTEWFVYTPDGNSDNDGITTMEPGWGYWILANDDTELLIGGSLISPAMTPPDINIVSGWNLVGYYGINGPGCPDGICTEYNGPAGNGKEARCMLNTLGNSIWDKGFTSLWTYWEPDNPNQWKDLDQYDNLDPGAGYWLFSQEEGIYAPSTTCSGFF